MTNINLLPWRAIKREQAKKMLITCLIIGCISAISLAFLVNYYVLKCMDYQTERNQLLKNEIIFLDNRIKEIAELKKKRAAMIARMQIVRDLEATRPLTVHLFDELSKVTPPGVVITKIQRQKQTVTVWGYAESNTNISELMRNIDVDQWIQDPELTEIKNVPQVPGTGIVSTPKPNEFKLSFSVKQNNVPKLDKTTKKQ